MFRPRTSAVSHEEFGDSSRDVVLGDGQILRGSRLQLSPLTGAVTPVDLGWVDMIWDHRSELDPGLGQVDLDWTPDLNNLPISSPQFFDFEPGAGFLRIRTYANEYQILRQKAGGMPGTARWVDQVDNAQGWTVQARVQASVSQPDQGPYHGHFLLLDDGTRRERIFIQPTGLFFENSPELNVRADFLSQPVTLRIAALQDDIYLLLEDGRGFAAPDYFTGASEEKELSFGTTGVVGEVETLWDHVYQKHGGVFMDDHSGVVRIYNTDGAVATTSAYAPKRRLSKVYSAYAVTSGDLTGGTTTIEVQYRSSATEMAWMSFGSFVVDTIGYFRINLESMPLARDASDEVRFRITQVSTTGVAEPPRIERITVVGGFVQSALRMVPAWGHEAGGNAVLLEMMTGSDQMAHPSVSTTGLDALYSLDGTYEDDLEGTSLQPAGAVSFVPGIFEQALQVGTAVESPKDVDAVLNSYVWANPYGRVGVGISPVHSSLTGTLSLSEWSLTEVVNGAVLPYAAQRAFAAVEGDGFQIPASEMTDVDALGLLLEVNQGSVVVQTPAKTFRVSVAAYGYPQRIVFETSAGNEVSFLAGEQNSGWSIARPRAVTLSGGSLEATGVPHSSPTGMGADVYLTPLVIREALVMRQRLGMDGWDLGVAPGGYPFVRIGSGVQEDALTGDFPLKVDRRVNIGWNYRIFDDRTGLQVLMDGEVIAEKITTVDQIGDGLDLTVGPLEAVYDQVRIHAGPLDAHKFSILNGLSNPSFDSEMDIPPDPTNTVHLRFYERRGAVRDSSGHDRHVRIPADGRAGFLRNRFIGNRTVSLFWYQGRLEILHSAGTIQDLPQALMARGIWSTMDFVQEVYSKWNASGTIGWKVEILTDGTVKVTVEDGVLSHSLTSSVMIGDGNQRSLYVEVTETGIIIRIDGVEDELVEAIGSIAAADQDASIGRNLVGYMMDFLLRGEALDTTTYDQWRNPALKKWTPTGDIVYFDNVAVPNADVIHYSPTRKYVTAPAGKPGHVPVYIESRGVSLVTEVPYKYTHGYSREIPAERIAVVTTGHSPFRMVNRIPPGGVNLAFIQAQDMSVDRNVSYTDLSFGLLQNLSTYFGGEFPLLNPETGVGYLDYTGQVDTDDLRLSNRAVVRRNVKEPTPLFYRYLIGRGRRYVKQPSAVSVSDIEVIRAGIQLINSEGQVLPFGAYPWDIELGRYDVNGVLLPDNVFSVVLYTNRAFLEETTVRVRYNAVDALHGFVVNPNFIEIVNPVPIFTPVNSATPGLEEYRVTLQDNGVYDLRVGFTGEAP